MRLTKSKELSYESTIEARTTQTLELDGLEVVVVPWGTNTRLPIGNTSILLSFGFCAITSLLQRIQLELAISISFFLEIVLCVKKVASFLKMKIAERDQNNNNNNNIGVDG